MGNRVYASRFRIIGILSIAIALVLLINPLFADAARSQALVSRLCDRQASLAGRLFSNLIDPSLCQPTPPTEPTLSFTATPTTVTAGDNSTLTWASTNATSCVASNGWSGTKSLSGNEQVSPSSTTTYALDCTGAGGTIHKEVTVNVTAAPVPTLTFTANPLTVLANGTTTLAWNSENTSLCVATNGWTGNKATGGSQDIAVAATSTYALSCGGVNGTTSASVTVNVTPHPLPTVTLTANPINVTPGAGSATSTLSWTSTNATACTAFNGWSGSKATSGSEIVSPSATTTYQLDCSGPGGVGSDDAIVNFVPTPAAPLPGITFSASPTNVTPGAGSATSTLTWSTTNANVCIASNGWSGAQALSGTAIVQPIATTTYQLDCGNVTGTTTASVTVNFVPTPVVPAEGKLLISELIYDLGVGQGQEPGNEWVELYNGTNSAINLGGYFIHDSAGSDLLPAVSLPAGKFAVISGSSTTQTLWTIPGDALFILLPNASIGSNGLGNDGDEVWLESTASTTVDAISWGTNTTAFFPSVSVVSASGHSSARSSITLDTDAASDWIDRTTPTPGQ